MSKHGEKRSSKNSNGEESRGLQLFLLERLTQYCCMNYPVDQVILHTFRNIGKKGKKKEKLQSSWMPQTYRTWNKRNAAMCRTRARQTGQQDPAYSRKAFRVDCSSSPQVRITFVRYVSKGRLTNISHGNMDTPSL